MKKIFCYFLMSWLMSGCATLLPTSKSQITFMDIEVFDRELSTAMSAHLNTITVDTVGEVSINQMPKRLGEWLKAVTDNQGQIKTKPKTKSLAWVLGLLPIIHNVLRKEFLYSYASDYDATIFLEPTTGKVKKIVFSQKSSKTKNH